MDECRAEYDRECERCMAEEIPEYLARDSARERKMMARFRCWNVERENRRRCRMYYEERERQSRNTK
ncbi:hypothetical protein MTP99_018515 [Tenebrio molitor]|nr:hypothetical protein MTP99_018515 [Tenebrio molitor]